MKMSDLCLRIWNWCCRFRHRCGYGVHSPSDFFLITSVIYEKMPYYAFQLLHYSREDEKDQLFHYREKTDRLLFRLVNYLQPASMLEIGTGCGLDTRYMAEAKHVPLFTIDEERQDKARIKHVLSAYPLVDYRTGNVLRLLDEALTGRPFADLIHIGHTPYYKEAFERLLSMVTDRTCIIVGAPYATREKKRWWKQTIADTRTGVTFDLYDIGLVFFDKKRVKEHRIVNFL
ncbi:hypothetical protein H6A67_11255 [Bacteroides gallinaceum]|nr:hypothetical protein [Bacteroides gallinaceum]MBM6659237.1 hypothetical protein [Bacteroides gallinaceum]